MYKTMTKVLILFMFSLSALASVGPGYEDKLLKSFKVVYQDKRQFSKLKEEVLTSAGKAVPVLIKVMKSSDYPMESRWAATFLLGQITGKQGIPFIAKFSKHPDWVMRTASLKTLLALNERERTDVYTNALIDESLIVRTQALENVSSLKLTKLGPHVWSMLFRKENYYHTKKGLRRSEIVNRVIRTLGEIKYEKAQAPMLAMINNNKYDDIFSDLDYSLSLITGKSSPKGDISVKRVFWKQLIKKT